MIFLVAALLSSFAYVIWLVKKKRITDLLPLIASVVTASIIYLLLKQYQLGAHYNILAIELSIALISSMLVQLYMSKPRMFVALTLLMLSGFLLYSYSHFSGFTPIGIFGMSTMYGLLYRNGGHKHVRRKVNNEKSKEVIRDIIQITMGTILVVVLALLKFDAAVPVIFTLIILGYVLNDLSGEKSLRNAYKAVESRLERSGVVYGSGALYIAAGAALVIGFVNNPVFAIFGMIVLFFADSTATIVGINLGFMKLPYNRNKSVLGSLSFFLVTALLGYFVIGTAAFALGALLAVVESADTHMDDNVSLAIAIVIASVLVPL